MPPQAKTIQFFNRTTPIILQNDNGPCPLLAICNVLLLRNQLNLNTDMGEISQERLLSLVAERLIDLNSNTENKDLEYVHNQEQNISDAIDLLPRLTTGIDVNIKFKKIHDFEFTPECAVFDLLGIPLYHGWLVDPQMYPVSIQDLSSQCPLILSGRYRGNFPEVVKARGIVADKKNFVIDLKVEKAKDIPLNKKRAAVQHLYLGRNPPVFTEMRVLHESSDDDDLVLELGINFLTADDMSAVLAAKLRKRAGLGIVAKMHLTSLHVEGKFRDDNSPYYNIDLKEMHVAGKRLPLNPRVFDQKHGTVLDSGTTYAYLPNAAFQAFKHAILNELHGLEKVSGPDPNYNDICFSGAGSDVSELSKSFPNVDLMFVNGQKLSLSPENYLFGSVKPVHQLLMCFYGEIRRYQLVYLEQQLPSGCSSSC